MNLLSNNYFSDDYEKNAFKEFLIALNHISIYYESREEYKKRK
jgi:hypothetical protein